jgi:hypothetical protein
MKGRGGLFIEKIRHQLLDRAADVRQPLFTSAGLCTLVQRVSHMSKYYPKGIPKSSICPVVPCTSGVLFAEHTSGGPPSYVRITDRSVRPPPVGQCQASIPRGSKRD